MAPALMSLKTEVCIIGGGVAGLSVAYFLSQAGVSVCVIENAAVGGGQTSASTAHLTYILDTRYTDFEKKEGRGVARAIAHSHRLAINTIERAVKREHIACGFQRLTGYRFGLGKKGIKELKEDLRCLNRLGIKGAKLIKKAPIVAFDTGPALRVPQQAQCDARDYVQGLAKAVKKKGGRILTHTRAVKVLTPSLNHVEILTPKHRITARAVVFATFHPPSIKLRLRERLKPVRSFVIRVQIPRGTLKRALYWDTCDPYHYLRLDNSNRLFDTLMIGGEDRSQRRRVNRRAAFKQLKQWTRDHFPAHRQVNQWSGSILYSDDGRAFLGRTQQKNIFVMTGDSANGVTYATIGALIIRDQYQGRKNHWENIYNPERS